MTDDYNSMGIRHCCTYLGHINGDTHRLVVSECDALRTKLSQSKQLADANYAKVLELDKERAALREQLKDTVKMLDLINSHAFACIISSEEECDMSANWVEARTRQALSKLKSP